MKPDDNVPNNQNRANNSEASRQAAAQLIRNKLDNIYDTDQTTEKVISDLENSALDNPQAEQWKKYHTAWQDYYQKYYEGYYSKKYGQSNQYGNHYFTHQTEHVETENKTTSSKEAVSEMRDKLLNQVAESAEKVKKSRHFIPILAGLLVSLIFLFIQYNSFVIAKIVAYVSPGSLDVQNIVVDPNASIEVGPEPRIIIPKINVDAPVTYDIGNDYDSLMSAMSTGLAHFAIPGANSHPGQVGNTVISGHSSNDLFDGGDYKFIFVQLEKLGVGDTIYANYESKRYTYIVTRTEVVGPNDVSKLVYETAKPILTLITCVPVGTADSRLFVVAEQVSPNPSTASQAPASDATEIESIPGKQPTLLEWLFGRRN